MEHLVRTYSQLGDEAHPHRREQVQAHERDAAERALFGALDKRTAFEVKVALQLAQPLRPAP